MEDKLMTYKETLRQLSNKELFSEIVKYGGGNPCLNHLWCMILEELKIRLGIKTEEVEEAIAYFRHGISHDIFSEDMIKTAKISLEALERMKSEL